MKYDIGDRVKIKSLDWYNKNKTVFEGTYFVSCDCGRGSFTDDMVKYCGEILTIKSVDPYYGCYFIKEDKECWLWTDEMFEGLVEEPVLSAPNITEGVFMHEKDMKRTTEYILPDGYIFKDENGNVINTNKIVLEKQKKEYPKTYEECAMLLRLGVVNELKYRNLSDVYKKDLIVSIQKLLICRDAYWKIYGEENDLGRPWENGSCEVVYGICRDYDDIVKQDDYWGGAHIFEFPTREMRDTFYENFKKEIEICKEFL